MALSMLVALYTTRIVLEMLGVVDFGIYNVVGGLVILAGSVVNSMASASQRFLSFEIGKANFDKLKRTFSITLSIYLIFSILVLILSETVGLWFFYNKLNIPDERYFASFWVYQLSVFAFVANILRVPFNASIIAHEKMGFYAWTSFLEVLLKLLLIYCLILFDFDKLILYSILTLVVVFITTLIYILYCYFKFPETRYKFVYEKEIFISIMNFSGWTIFDSTANVAKKEGVNILLNIFFNSTINSARGIAFQVSNQVTSFVGNFQTAVSPQMTKYYASKEYFKLKTLYFRSSKFTFYLLYALSLPVILEMEILLGWWLSEVPEYTLIFVRLIIINVLIDSFAGTTNLLIQATGNIKNYQVFSGIIIFLNLPISYLFLRNGYPPEITIIISIFISALLVFGRLVIANSIINFNLYDYFKNVILRNIEVCILCSSVPVFIFLNSELGLSSFLLIFFTSIISTLISIYIVGLETNEKTIIRHFIIKKIKFE